MNFHKIAVRLTCISIVVLHTGCQTNAQTGALVGSAFGCAMGNLLDKGNKKNIAKCAEGALPLALAGYYVGRQRDLELAREAADGIRASQPVGMVGVHMKTTSIAVPEASRPAMKNVTSIESLDTMIVSVPQPQIERMDPKAAATLARVGKYVSDAAGSSVVTIAAQTPKEYDFIVASMQSGYGKNLAPQKVIYQFKQLARGTQATVEVSPTTA